VLRIQIRIKLKGRIRIQIRINVKSWIRIRIKVISWIRIRIKLQMVSQTNLMEPAWATLDLDGGGPNSKDYTTPYARKI
jgi:hypothetical protein